MIVAMTAEQMRAYDRHAMEARGIPGLVLMENAGQGAARRIAERMAQASGPAVVVCGCGNNGGDGFVVARHLEASGLATEVFLVGRREDVTGDARVHLDALDRLGIEVLAIQEDLSALVAALERASLIVDALFGTGLSRPVAGVPREVIERIGATLKPVIALDVPSGIDATTGSALGLAVRAARTLTFAHWKTGLLQGDGVRHAGEVEVVGLAVPDREWIEALEYEAERFDPADALVSRGWRAPDTHKYRAGSVLVVAGSPGKSGAALLAATAALRGGAGLATIATWPEVLPSVDGRVFEVMTAGLDRASLGASLEAALDRRAAVVIGPGLGLDEAAREVTERVVLGWRGPVVVDADALAHFGGRSEELASALGPRILTPHAGELARLLGGNVDTGDRFAVARLLARQTNAVVIAKGPHTLIAHPSGALRFIEGAEPLLATAGSGDVLAGVLGALVAHAPDLDAAFDAASLAALVHLRAARIWRDRLAVDGRGPDRGLLASDLVHELPRALASL